MRAVLSDGVVRLRAWTATDAAWYAQVATSDELIQRFTSEPSQLSAEQVQAAIAGLADKGDLVGLVICDEAGGERLGNIGLSHADGIGQVSYWLAAQARGRGVATRALRLLSTWAWQNLPVDELRLWTHADNVASQRVAQRAGYVRQPEYDQTRMVRSEVWQTLGYRLPATGAG